MDGGFISSRCVFTIGIAWARIHAFRVGSLAGFENMPMRANFLFMRIA